MLMAQPARARPTTTHLPVRLAILGKSLGQLGMFAVRRAPRFAIAEPVVHPGLLPRFASGVWQTLCGQDRRFTRSMLYYATPRAVSSILPLCDRCG